LDLSGPMTMMKKMLCDFWGEVIQGNPISIMFPGMLVFGTNPPWNLTDHVAWPSRYQRLHRSRKNPVLQGEEPKFPAGHQNQLASHGSELMAAKGSSSHQSGHTVTCKTVTSCSLWSCLSQQSQTKQMIWFHTIMFGAIDYLLLDPGEAVLILLGSMTRLFSSLLQTILCPVDTIYLFSSKLTKVASFYL
jgi:hypothetical protein